MVTPRGAEIWRAFSTTVGDSTAIRFRVKPTADIGDAQVLIWSDALKDNARYFLPALRRGEWTSVEIRPVGMCAGWSQDGKSLDGCTLDNFKLFFAGADDVCLLLDDFEVFE